MDFVDTTRIRVCSGKGGSGCVSFRREKYVRFGGPDGGDGGNGGDVGAVASSNVSTLAAYRRRQLFRAGSGLPGSGRNRSGAAGQHRWLEVPAGTEFTDCETGVMIGDLSEAGARLLLAGGGRGGAGNARFATSTNRAPRHMTPGEHGVERLVEMRLKLLADAGLVGLPNAGKSALICAVSNARSKIADYPFSTLRPYLGVVRRGYEAFVLADIPGLIDGAHTGAGLGHRFLRHVERCAVLLHLVDGTSRDVAADYLTVRRELAAYGHGLSEKPFFVCISKVDLLSEEESASKIGQLRAVGAAEARALSGVSGEGVEVTLQALWNGVLAVRKDKS